jgi:hypothetical protein
VVESVRSAAVLLAAAGAFVVLTPLALITAACVDRNWDEAIAASEDATGGEWVA